MRTIDFIGILKSKKPDEKRIPILPEHLKLIDPRIRKLLFFEKGYGKDFDTKDDFFAKHAGGVLSRSEILKNANFIINVKPIPKDLLLMKQHSILWGWVHCIQNKRMTQAAIDKKLTLMAFELMYYWNNESQKQAHVFYKNNEISGSVGVSEALRVCGYATCYGAPLKAAVLGFGSVGRGVVRGLKQACINDITVYTERDVQTIPDKVEGIIYKQIVSSESGNFFVLEKGKEKLSLLKELKTADVIVNAILQDPQKPKTFIYRTQLRYLKAGTIIVDISCDQGIGFDFAKPTSFKHPVRHLDRIVYYSVDHIPSCVWHSSSFEISESLLPFLPILTGLETDSKKELTLQKSIEILDGKILNPMIIAVQGREIKYPHKRK